MELNDTAIFFCLLDNNLCIKSALYKYKNRDLQEVVHIWCPLECQWSAGNPATKYTKWSKKIQMIRTETLG